MALQILGYEAFKPVIQHGLDIFLFFPPINFHYRLLLYAVNTYTYLDILQWKPCYY